MGKAKHLILILLLVTIPVAAQDSLIAPEIVVSQDSLIATGPVISKDSLLIPEPAVVQDQIVTQKKFTLQPESKLWIDGTSTLHDYTLTSNEIIVEIKSNPDGFANLIKTKDNAVFSMKVTIPVRSLKSDKKGLDKNFLKAMKEKKYKNIVYELTEYNSTALPDSGDNWYLIETKGELTVAGVKKNIDMKVIANYSSDGSIHFKGNKLINMKDYNIKPPSFMFGVLKTNKYVTIFFDLTFKEV